MKSHTGASHRPGECTSAPCSDDRCVNGVYGVAETAAVQLLWATQVTTAERAAVAYGHTPSQPLGNIATIREDLEFVLDLLAKAPERGLRYFIDALTGLLPDVFCLPIDPVGPPEHRTQRGASTDAPLFGFGSEPSGIR